MGRSRDMVDREEEEHDSGSLGLVGMGHPTAWREATGEASSWQAAVGKDVLAIIGGIDKVGNKPIINGFHSIVFYHDRDPAAVMDAGRTAFRRGAGFFQYRRLAKVTKFRHRAVLDLVNRRTCT